MDNLYEITSKKLNEQIDKDLGFDVVFEPSEKDKCERHWSCVHQMERTNLPRNEQDNYWFMHQNELNLEKKDEYDLEMIIFNVFNKLTKGKLQPSSDEKLSDFLFRVETELMKGESNE